MKEALERVLCAFPDFCGEAIEMEEAEPGDTWVYSKHSNRGVRFVHQVFQEDAAPDFSPQVYLDSVRFAGRPEPWHVYIPPSWKTAGDITTYSGAMCEIVVNSIRNADGEDVRTILAVRTMCATATMCSAPQRCMVDRVQCASVCVGNYGV